MAVIVGNTLTDLAQADLANDQNTTARRSAERNFLAALAQLQAQQSMGRDRNQLGREELSSRERIAAGDTSLRRALADIEASTVRRGQDVNERVGMGRNQVMQQEAALKNALDRLQLQDLDRRKTVEELRLQAQINANNQANLADQTNMAGESENAAIIGNNLYRQAVEAAQDAGEDKGFMWFDKPNEAFQAFKSANPTPQQRDIINRVQQNAIASALQALGENAGLVGVQGGTNLVPRYRRPSMGMPQPAAQPGLSLSPDVVAAITNILSGSNQPQGSMIFGMPNTNAPAGAVTNRGYRIRPLQ